MAIQTFSAGQLDVFREAGSILKACLEMLQNETQLGANLLQLDAMAEEFIREHKGATPAFKGYHGFPNTLCTSVNEECVHAIPRSYNLQDGDIVSLDCGVLIEGLYTDACITVGVGTVQEQDKRLMKASKTALEQVLPLIKAGVPVGTLSAAIQAHVEAAGFTVIRSLTGHGLGDDLHGEPSIPNFGKAGTGPSLLANSVIAIEPIVCVGKSQIITAPNGWSIMMKDGKNSAHFEHSVIVLEGGYEVIA